VLKFGQVNFQNISREYFLFMCPSIRGFFEGYLTLTQVLAGTGYNILRSQYAVNSNKLKKGEKA
jgi:hypothetical protein